ncbi:YlqD family protein [Desulforamulus aeronauticus]|uniref:YlqD protein n=1 Tax=Desulforamulus aeronauticus DSM 10349 TaxID=1121421 RepID=A0A1M6W152_9FIRM|nr:YlqD family protein [Desulforamulus aeronauticus]SHK87255.1 YlqD protein [Desulforamulus aeronauticus DSM 10349]
MLTITRPVMVKVRITDSYKKDLALELQQGVAKMELELQQLELQNRRLQELAQKNPNSVEKALVQIEQEKQKRLDTRVKLLDKIKEVANLANGNEVLHGQVESLVEVQLGDDWQKLMNAEIIVEDGKIVEIRTLQPGGSL